ncbi:Calcium permeable stress-gated cation channel 1 [Hibiscus syriacus]|uniref:Calcium permeable stress-gated cation channel 1 n=1 Tax=Hibiscus syriacus TaxID=106335 RepID=A0A6A2WML4_HIBSY|nr:Calcium permeable stress-gated cation channel 1 [Hibiscus syriacus]
MATLSDIGVAAAINILTAFAFLLAFAILRIQPVNDRVYFPKWYLKGLRSSPLVNGGAFGSRFVNFDWRSYIRFLNWMPAALRMPEPELINHAGLDSVIYLRIYLLGLKYCSGRNLSVLDAFGNGLCLYVLDMLRSEREYEIVAAMRLHFLASEQRRPDQFTVLVRNVPPDPHESVTELVEHFFLVNHPDHYLSQRVVYNANKLSELTGFLGLWGNRVDAIDFYTSKAERLSRDISVEREEVTSNPKSIIPAAFVSFKTRWGAAVCAQTQQSRNQLHGDRVGSGTTRCVLGKPGNSISIVQSLANIESIEKAFPFLKPIIEVKFIKSLIQGFLPGIALKIFLIFLPTILMIMSKFEGFISLSSLERRSASRYYIFQFVNVFLGSIITGTAFQQLNNFIHQSTDQYVLTYAFHFTIQLLDWFHMHCSLLSFISSVDGWAGVAGEILRLKPLIIYHLKNFFLVKTEKDREEAMDPGTIGFNTGEPQIQLYFLLGLVYAVVTPILLPFMIVFFGFAYVVYRHQVRTGILKNLNESAAAFWPHVHVRIIVALIVAASANGITEHERSIAVDSIAYHTSHMTICFHRFCKGRYEPAFRYPLQNAYVPVFKSADDCVSDGDNNVTTGEWEQEPSLIATKRTSKRFTPLPSKDGGSLS